MSLVVRALEEVDIIRRDESEVERAGDFYKVRVATSLGVNPVVVELDEEIFFSEEVAIPGRDRFRRLEVAVLEQGVDLALEAAAQHDEPLRVLRQQILVHPRFVVKPLEVGGGGQFDQVLVAIGVGSQNGQVVGRIFAR